MAKPSPTTKIWSDPTPGDTLVELAELGRVVMQRNPGPDSAASPTEGARPTPAAPRDDCCRQDAAQPCGKISAPI